MEAVGIAIGVPCFRLSRRRRSRRPKRRHRNGKLHQKGRQYPQPCVRYRSIIYGADAAFARPRQRARGRNRSGHPRLERDAVGYKEARMAGICPAIGTLGLVERASDYLTRQSVGELPAFRQHGAVDDYIVDPDSLPLDLHAAGWKVSHRLTRLRRDGVGVEDRDVSRFARRDEAAIGEVVHQRGLAGQAVHRLFERHRLLLAHPMPEQMRAVLLPVGGVRASAAVTGADHGVARAEDFLLRLRVAVAVDGDEASLQILVERQVEEGVHHALALILGDLGNALAFEVPVLPAGRHEHLHQIPAPVEEAAGAAASVGHRPLLGDAALDRLGGERLADPRVAEGAHALLVRQRHDLVPARHAVENAVRVCYVLVLRNIEPTPQVKDRAGDDRHAGAVAARAALERPLEPFEMLLPLLGPLATWKTPVPSSPKTLASAQRSASGPTPAGSPRSFGAVEKPSAPAYMASRTSFCIWTISSGVASPRSEAASPIT